MRITELKENSKIIISVEINKQRLEFPTEVYATFDQYILVKPVLLNEKVVGISGENISISITYVREQKSPILWKGAGCSLVKFKGNVYYKMIASGEGFEVNRREAFRLHVGIKAVAQIGTNSKAVNVVLKDVSNTGFAIVYNEDIEEYQNKVVRITFNDLEENFILAGLVIRKVQSEEGKIIYGCKIAAKNQVLSRYINIKQRHMLASNRDKELELEDFEYIKSIEKNNSESKNEGSEGNEGNEEKIEKRVVESNAQKIKRREKEKMEEEDRKERRKLFEKRSGKNY